MPNQNDFWELVVISTCPHCGAPIYTEKLADKGNVKISPVIIAEYVNGELPVNHFSCNCHKNYQPTVMIPTR